MIIKKYEYFGLIEVITDEETSIININDNFSQKQIQFQINNVLIQVEVMNDYIVFLSNKSKIFIYAISKEVSFFLILKIFLRKFFYLRKSFQNGNGYL